MELAVSNSNPTSGGFICHTCGKWHDGLALDVGYSFPDYYSALSESERSSHGWCDGDFCVLDDDRFIRGCLEIPIVDGDRPFVYGVWTTLSHANFARARSLWHIPVPRGEPPYFGWLSNRLADYPDTMNLKVDVHLRDKWRPRLILERTSHPLSIEQREGITLARVQRIVELIMHRDST